MCALVLKMYLCQRTLRKTSRQSDGFGQTSALHGPGVYGVEGGALSIAGLTRFWLREDHGGEEAIDLADLVLLG